MKVTVRYTDSYQSFYSAGDESELYCLNCDESINDEVWNYCPNCGAKLIYVEDKED